MTERPTSIRQGLQMMNEAAKAKTVPIDKAKGVKPLKPKKPTAKIPGQEPDHETQVAEAVRKIRAAANKGSAADLLEAKKGRESLKKFATKHGLELPVVHESFIGWAEARGYAKRSVDTVMVSEWLASLGK